MNGWTGNEFSKFSEVLYKVTVRSKYTRALTVEIFLVGAVLHYAASMGGTEVCEFLVTNCSARVDAVRYMCRMCSLMIECVLLCVLCFGTNCSARMLSDMCRMCSLMIECVLLCVLCLLLCTHGCCQVYV